MPAARAARQPIAAVAAALTMAACGGAPDYTVLSRTAPDAAHVAAVRLTRCGTAWCQSLWIGPSGEDATRVATLQPDTERAGEIAWSTDSARVAFLIDGHQLRIFDARTHAPAGQLDLVPADATPTSRVARGVTFSDTGAAITFDDCPRGRSGCRPGLVAMR